MAQVALSVYYWRENHSNVATPRGRTYRLVKSRISDRRAGRYLEPSQPKLLVRNKLNSGSVSCQFTKLLLRFENS